ncbi:MurR/RpiR family transcriptional regulator [Rhodoferax aquaticus]|uniref:MurR/RpiR family transcriptional regulator n=1 Tax=Rhodoferax aquaticus TaxID=2527691 RepID=A0A515ELU2_9BURK|nr:MurR/RpiR family transcriptional regulator [Rhodoferax aquaticus]QDL53599.1 MurR/RpiR family transcriptional regulator [Rhodoferax aquaticus]
MNPTEPSSAPASEEALIAAIAREFDGLSRQLKQIGQYVEQHRGQLGIQSIQQVAELCQVQPSAIVRFAKHFGFSGYSELQKLFREGLARQISPSRDYQSRIRGAIESGAQNLSSSDIVHAMIGAGIAGMEELEASLQEPAFDAAVNLLFEADTVWLMGSRRSFAITTYLAYALQHTDKRVQHITALGNMQDGQLRGLRKGDVMVAISFAPYAPETETVVREASERGAHIICITDSSLSPMCRVAQASILVNETSVFGFRALTNTMTVAQSLFMALAYRLELQYKPTRA